MDREGAYTEVIYNWLHSIAESRERAWKHFGLGGKTKILAFGNPDEKILDLVYVGDVVDAIISSTEHWNNETYNVSTESGISVSELIKTIERTLNVSLDVEIVPDNRTDIEKKRVGSIEKLRSIGWTPNTSIESGLLKTWEWVQTL